MLRNHSSEDRRIELGIKGDGFATVMNTSTIKTQQPKHLPPDSHELSFLTRDHNQEQFRWNIIVLHSSPNGSTEKHIEQQIIYSNKSKPQNYPYSSL